MMIRRADAALRLAFEAAVDVSLPIIDTAVFEAPAHSKPPLDAKLENLFSSDLESNHNILGGLFLFISEILRTNQDHRS